MCVLEDGFNEPKHVGDSTAQTLECATSIFFRSFTVHLNTIKVFICQLMHKRVSFRTVHHKHTHTHTPIGTQ